MVPTGLFFGRLGNFIGQELYGRPTDMPWAMLFPSDPLQLPRHPSQLYEAFLEGFVLFFALYYFARRPRETGQIAGLFLILYGLFRFVVEFVREPDAQFAGQTALIESFNWMTRGQALCVPMILLGLWFMRKAFAIEGANAKPSNS
jgi:phosphatidylglycerol:prolipoprotein diacylglycerol transferase